MRIRLTLVFLLLLAGNAFSQWELVAPNLFSNQTGGGYSEGVLTHIKGVLWTGCHELLMSIDTGKTWAVRTPTSFQKADRIRSIVFLNNQIGLVTTKYSCIFLTYNGGTTWKDINPVVGCGPEDGVFIGSSNYIAFSTTSGDIYISTNGGNSWNSKSLGGRVISLVVGNNNTLYATVRNNQYPDLGSLFKTTDYGQSWIRTTGNFDFDSYSLALDSCNTFYVANEESQVPVDDSSCVFVSTNEGMTWSARDKHAASTQNRYHCGSLSVSGIAIYSQTYHGISRSTDRGTNWQKIGGPSNTIDTRFVCALSENMIVAIDTLGNVWRTFNSGGDSVHSTVKKDTLYFSTDTLFALQDTRICNDSAEESLHIYSDRCIPLHIIERTIEGIDSSDYKILNSLGDSIRILFKPQGMGIRNASLRLKLSDGTIKRIPIAGTGINSPINITVSSDSLFERDTILKCDSISRGFRITINACMMPRILSATIEGAASNDYTTLSPLGDTLQTDNLIDFKFKPTTIGFREAIYKITLENGQIITIPLAGNVIKSADSISLSRDTLFASKTLFTCNDSAEETLHIDSYGCHTLNVIDKMLEGIDSADYEIISSSSDSIRFRFKPRKEGLRNASLILKLSDGTTKRIPIAGRGIKAPVTISVTPNFLFERDSIYICEQVKRSVRITASGCPLPKILSNTIQGIAANDYASPTTHPDTLQEDNLIELEFKPTTTGYREAVYSLILEDGQVIMIPLSGNALPSLSPFITSQKAFHTDTIGGLISIPITINGLDKPRDVKMTLHYDVGLDYIGTTSLSGTSLDIAGSAEPGIVKILIPASEIKLSGISAYANFNVFPDSVSSWNISFDSLLLPNASSPCDQNLTSFTATITAPKGCGIGTLTKFIRTGKITLDRIIPNPARGMIDVIFTLPAEDLVSFELVDMNGVVLQLLSSTTFVTGNHTLHFDLSNIASGSYLVRMTNASGYSLVQKFVNSR
jgi:photosystem II stability/assembly factor-like uncharacterized protein